MPSTDQAYPTKQLMLDLHNCTDLPIQAIANLMTRLGQAPAISDVRIEFDRCGLTLEYCAHPDHEEAVLQDVLDTLLLWGAQYIQDSTLTPSQRGIIRRIALGRTAAHSIAEYFESWQRV